MGWIRAKVDTMDRGIGGAKHFADRSFRPDDVEFVDHVPAGGILVHLRSGVRFLVVNSEVAKVPHDLGIPPS
jgi:hypothetical protein